MRLLIDVTDPKTQMKLQLLPLDKDDETIEELKVWEGDSYQYIVMKFTDTTMELVDKCTPAAGYVHSDNLPELLL